ncbi:MAG TPA: FAD-dependent oxidoreductase [Candidatus Binataceae bacterium]|nr:FAD-dependent oxidoreductase [Candidatus Binataceae bacterium]
MATPTGFITEAARQTPVKAETEVLVIGGGTAGVSAAVAAARSGADVILVERLGYLGGLATGGLIALLLTLDDGRGRQVIGGLCQEITDRLQARGAAHFPSEGEWGSADEKLIARDQQWGLVWGHGPHRVRYSVAYDAEEFKFALNTMAEEAKARLLFHCYANDAIVEGDRIAGVTFQSKAGRFAILAKTVIDASGDGDIFTSAGAPFEKEAVLPWLWFTMGGVENAEAAIEKGRWFFRTLGDGRVLLPWGATERVARKIDATDPDDLSYAELACRRRVMEQVDSMRAEIPGFARAHICHIADQLGITESRRLVGRHVLGHDEVDHPCDDVIAITGNWTKYESLYYIPYGSLLAANFTNLMVAGRCISVDHRVHHATKEIPPCMATGEAAGVAAALSVRAGIDPAALEVKLIQKCLEEQGAILRLP